MQKDKLDALIVDTRKKIKTEIIITFDDLMSQYLTDKLAAKEQSEEGSVTSALHPRVSI